MKRKEKINGKRKEKKEIDGKKKINGKKRKKSKEKKKKIMPEKRKKKSRKNLKKCYGFTFANLKDFPHENSKRPQITFVQFGFAV